jgi:hypothetical protein
MHDITASNRCRKGQDATEAHQDTRETARKRVFLSETQSPSFSKNAPYSS